MKKSFAHNFRSSIVDAAMSGRRQGTRRRQVADTQGKRQGPRKGNFYDEETLYFCHWELAASEKSWM